MQLDRRLRYVVINGMDGQFAISQLSITAAAVRVDYLESILFMVVELLAVAQSHCKNSLHQIFA